MKGGRDTQTQTHTHTHTHTQTQTQTHTHTHLLSFKGAGVLHVACDRGHAHVVALLLENGANIDARDNDNATPLHYGLSAEVF